jgi:hypothetical protein
MARVVNYVALKRGQISGCEGHSSNLIRWAVSFALVGFLVLSALGQDPLPTINLLETDRISILAEKAGQRSYAERFAELVYEAANATTGESVGKGLVIMGNYDQPHPIVLVK